MSTRVPLQLRRGLFVAASIVSLQALLILLCYAATQVQRPSATQPHLLTRTMIQPRSTLSQEQDIKQRGLNVSMLTVTMTGCSKAADWQALGLYHSFLRCTPGAMCTHDSRRDPCICAGEEIAALHSLAETSL